MKESASKKVMNVM